MGSNGTTAIVLTGQWMREWQRAAGNIPDSNQQLGLTMGVPVYELRLHRQPLVHRPTGTASRIDVVACPPQSFRAVLPKARGESSAAICSDRTILPPGGTTMRGLILFLALFAVPALAQDPFAAAKQLAGSAATKQVETEVNKKLLAEARKNQCSFKTDSDQLAPGCDKKLKNLASGLIEAKKRLNTAGLSNYKFEVSGHTDTTGAADHNKELSGKRATVIVKELVARGVPEGEIVAVGLGSERPLVKPDDTASKKAKNRRYEIQVRL
jgi:OOP family OmpA-OmpF porin